MIRVIKFKENQQFLDQPDYLMTNVYVSSRVTSKGLGNDLFFK